jgi:hypothetical protein
LREVDAFSARLLVIVVITSKIDPEIAQFQGEKIGQLYGIVRPRTSNTSSSMNLPLAISILILFVIGLAIAIDVDRLRSKKRRRRRALIAPPRRSPHLEKRMAAAFDGPRKTYGDCFAEFSIWRQLDNTRMEVRTNSAWLALNLFTRSLTLRHLWQMLESLVHGTVIVNVDSGSKHAMIWTAKQTDEFNDCGILVPWIPIKSRIGTLISGP